MKKLKLIIKRIIPSTLLLKIKYIKLVYKLLINYLYDFNRYKKYSGTIKQYDKKEKLEAFIIHTYHNIEKGLALKNTKIGFGAEKINYLISLLTKYIQKYGYDETTLVALNVLKKYYEFNKKKGLNLESLKNKISTLEEKAGITTLKSGGTKIFTNYELSLAMQFDFERFSKLRHSIRNFDTNKEVDIKMIYKAVDIARYTPSVCNRQTTRVHVFMDEKKRKKILSYQNGNRGFGQDAKVILLITSDLEHFHGYIERNQCYIDGGLFAMSLIYALHSLGLGTCPLNCSIDKYTDMELRKAAQLKDSETIIMMIAVGHIPNKIEVAYSHRKNLNRIMIIK